MPNWCFNKVTVTGDKKKMDVFKNKAFVNDEFKFQNLIPMPKELLDTTSGYLGENTPKQKELEKQQARNIKKYGYKDWYDWAYSKWGTKWDVDAYVEWDGDDVIEITFDSAWGPPEGVHKYIVNEFPDLSVSWFYDEPGMEVAGYLN